MGYYSTSDGEVTVSPPISFKEMWQVNVNYDAMEIKPVIREEEIITDEGILSKKEITGFTTKYLDSAKNYYTEENLNEVIRAFPGHTYTGYLHFVGEDGETWRVAVNPSTGKAESVKPEMIWPEWANE